jgi:predicted RNase H-like nuclease (RuvC/YqgF family)
MAKSNENVDNDGELININETIDGDKDDCEDNLYQITKDLLYCDKCSQSIDYFMSECCALSGSLTKHEKTKKTSNHYREKCYTLEFEVDELKIENEELKTEINQLKQVKLNKNI